MGPEPTLERRRRRDAAQCIIETTLVIQRFNAGLCTTVALGKHATLPGPTCDRCLSDDFAWPPLSGRGKVDPSDLREGMTLEFRGTHATDRFGEYNLPVFGQPATRG